MAQGSRSAFIALIGRPNVGKSSLLNRLLGHKVAIVSDKPQTTRGRLMGVLTRDETQLVFLDTPGMHRPRTRLGEYMVQSVSEAMSGVDAAVMVTEPIAELRESERQLIAQLKKNKLPAVLVINKIDTLEDKTALLQCIDVWQKEYPFDEVYPVSALTGEGTEELLETIEGYAFDSPHFFPDDMISDQPERVLAAELIREKLLLSLRQEIPHGTAVVTENWAERETAGGVVLDIDVTIYCERASHKGMIIGKRGAMLKEVATAARKEMEEQFGTKVNLQCWVKVKEDWRNRAGILSQLGYKL